MCKVGNIPVSRKGNGGIERLSSRKWQSVWKVRGKRAGQRGARRPSNPAEPGPPPSQRPANRSKRRGSGEGKASSHPRPLTSLSATGRAFSSLWPRARLIPRPGQKLKRGREVPEITHLPERNEGRDLHLPQRKYLPLRGAPGLHFPAFPRGIRATIPPPREAESRLGHLRPESNFSESTKGEGFAFWPSGSRNASEHAEHCIILSHFSSGANSFALSGSGSVPIPESVWTTHPRILWRTELPAYLKFLFWISRWSPNKPSGAVELGLPFFLAPFHTWHSWK